MTEFNELEKKKSQFLSRIKKRLERMCVHTRHAHTHTPPKILVVKQSHLPPPSLNKIRNQLSFSLYLPGAAWEVRLTLILIQHRTDKRIAPEESLPKKRHVYSHPISSRRISTPEKTISSLHLMLANTSWISIWIAALGAIGFPQRMWSLSPPKLEMW